MPLVKISSGGTGKKAIVVDGGKFPVIRQKIRLTEARLLSIVWLSIGIHAREWISPAFVTWLINELVENYAAHPQYVDNVDWYSSLIGNDRNLKHTNVICLH